MKVFWRLIATLILTSLLVLAVDSAKAFAAADYRLPVSPGQTVYVSQGNGVGDHVNGSQYAFDFEAHDTSFVVAAARSGIVIGERSDSSTTCTNGSCWKEANYVLIDHQDGTAGLYLHLATGSVLVSVGQHVEQGQPLAKAGHTGWAEPGPGLKGNHLHFQAEELPSNDAQRSQLPGWWLKTSRASSFSNPEVLAQDPSGVPKSGQTFTLAADVNRKISGTVYVDANGNGARDAGEKGSAGVTVVLSGASSASIRTDSSGIYSIGSLKPGNYEVTLSTPSAYKATTLNPASVVLGSVDSTVNFGIAPAPPPPPPTTVNISSTAGWQETPLILQRGERFSISYVSGSWTVDYNNFSYVGPGGYGGDEDQRIYQGCKIVDVPYATLLGQVGDGSIFVIGDGGTFTADAGGTLYLHINDDEACFGDNDGSVEVSVQKLS